MSKRIADKEMNHDNWADEEEVEDAGTFQQASQDEIKKRVIKTARRRANAEEPETKPKAIFSGFSFTKSIANEESQIKTNKSGGIFGNGESISIVGKETKHFKNTFESSEKISNTDKSNNEFYSQLKGLNESVSRWIKNHVDSDPICILTPIFKDYEKYLNEIQDKRKKKEEKNNDTESDKTMKNISSTPSSISGETFKTTPISSIFGAKPSESCNSETKLFLAKSDFTSKPEEPKKSTMMFSSGTATFSFGNSSTSPQSSLPTAGFSFGTGAPFTFGNVNSPAQNKEKVSKVEEEPDEDEPPKVEFKAVIEEGSVYTVRCKVFIKKNDTYVDGGVGNLFLKPVKDSVKTQLIVRADTNLGNLLINVLLSDSIPTQRMGKNNVMMVCIPTPEKGPTPSSILLRVKTAEQADELLGMINKHKC